MFNQSSLFFQRSKRIAEEFLQTTVIVDDQAYFDGEPPFRETPSPIPTDLVEPGRYFGTSRDKKELAVPDEEISQETGSHHLNARKVINSFAQKRIVCSVIKPIKDDPSWISAVEILASSADIIIVDWEINNDNGESALNLLEQIIKSAISGSPAQLRLFVIYTGDPGIAQIVESVKTTLEKRLKIEIDINVDGFSLTFASTRIAIFAKPDTSNLPQEYGHRKVSFENLADSVTSEFAVLTSGLVSNVAIKSLALVRKNTHKILTKFSFHLDAPYLTHRAFQTTPEDAEEFLATLIAEELHTILEEGYIGGEANLDAIKDWLSSSHDTDFILSLARPIQFSQQEIVALLEAGMEKWNGISKNQKHTKHKVPFTEMFCPKTINGLSLDEKFALITTVRSNYENRIPYLMFGTILQDVKSGEYWVCIQPRCDCVRIGSKRAFPFLPLKISLSDRKFNIIIDDNGQYIKLVLNDKPYDLNLITFTPRIRDKGVIKARENESSFYFVTSGKKKYKWVGVLRSEHAQRIANEFASNLSRVGLDESEWLRLWATKG